MTAEVYQELCATMAKRGGPYPGRDIPEFHALVRELFTPDEAAISNAMPKGFFTAEQVAAEAGRDPAEVGRILEAMADKGLCNGVTLEGQKVYGAPPFVPGIFEYQFMRGTRTERDRRLAGLIHAYKEAVDAARSDRTISFPLTRVISVDRRVKAGTRVHTYDQVSTYIEQYDPIAVATCFCRHEASLLDETDSCGQPNEVCLTFGFGAQFVSERGIGHRISKEEAREILEKCEEAGLVHCSTNTQQIDFLCNCCSCHCLILKAALRQPKPGLVLFSSFQPEWDRELCTACETCIERCPGRALTLGPEEVPEVDRDRCFGCGVCATGCPSEAITMVERPQAPAPPADRKALKEAVRAAQAV
ncbi:MAG: 4Fe-4S binding protein [Thermodesulfobacteriota bacterium]